MNYLGKPVTQRQLRVGEMIKQALGTLFIRDEAKIGNFSTKEITVKDYMDFQKNDTIEAFSITSTERSI